MKELVEHLFKHYHPEGNACRPVLVDNLVREGPFTKEEVYRMDMTLSELKEYLARIVIDKIMAEYPEEMRRAASKL